MPDTASPGQVRFPRFGSRAFKAPAAGALLIAGLAGLVPVAPAAQPVGVAPQPGGDPSNGDLVVAALSPRTYALARCHRITRWIPGAEDITIDQASGMAFVSSQDRRGKPPPPGAIYGFDLAAGDPRPRDLTSHLGLSFAFHPHGIGLWTGSDGERRLFVVNHRSEDEHTIEIFRYAQQRLIHVETIPGDADLLHSPNDLVPVGPRSFYVTNFRGARSGVGRAMEGIFRLRKSYVVYYDGSGYRKVAERLRYANGVNLSHDGRTVYVTTTLGGEVLLYRREANGDLTLERTIEVNTGADNLEVDEHGNLWIGAHPRAFTFVLYALELRERSPSQVIFIPYNAGEYGPPQEVFRDDGRLLSASSVAAVYQDRLLIGSVFAGFLECDLRR
jgi:arylesterase / paraoxonase